MMLIWTVSPSLPLFKQKEKIDNLNKSLKKLQSKNIELEQELRKLKSAAYIELLAREQLGLAKPDEETYVVVPSQTNTKSLPSPPPKDKKNSSTDNIDDKPSDNNIFVSIYEKIKELIGL